MTELRSQAWWKPDTLRSFMQRSRLHQLGLDECDYSRPIIAIIESNSEISPCHTHFPERREDIRRGILENGGFPIHIPVMSLSEPFQKPSTMLYRNMLAMEVEETLRSYPIDGAVLMGGCDKTTPGLIMGAISAKIPSVFFPGGPMLRGNANGKVLGSGTSGWKAWQDREAGLLTECELRSIEKGIARSAGHCMTMGTASTMTAVAEALGLAVAGSSSIPAVDSRHRQMAALTGRIAVDIARTVMDPEQYVTQESVHNAAVTIAALGGSTNAIIHLIAIARRAGLETDLMQLERVFKEVPVLANISPSGQYLMEDFYEAGGLLALMAEVKAFLCCDCVTVEGTSIGNRIESAINLNTDVIRTLDRPLSPEGSLAVLFGSLAPEGAVVKVSAASKELLVHRGRAVVFNSMKELAHGIGNPELDISKDSILVLRNSGPVGAPGMPEWGMLPIPKKLLYEGVNDLVRISDARMSGTAYGTCILHVAPESAVGGPLAFVENGDIICVDIPHRKIELEISEEELEIRRRRWVPEPTRWERGWKRMYVDQVTQASEGCDLKFLEFVRDDREIRDPEIW